MYLRTRADSKDLINPGNAISIPASGRFDGSDGKWCTFNINVGDDGSGNQGQNFRVLPSTSSAVTIVPGPATWCNQDCAQQRGVEIFHASPSLGFDTTASKGWNKYGNYKIPVPEWWTGTTNLDEPFGFDNVGIGPSTINSKQLGGQWVVISDKKDFFMGSFGLAAGPINPGAGPSPPFLTNFAAFNVSTSVSYGYTAGAIYRNGGRGVLGSLVLGGYDLSRLDSRRISIPMPSRTNNSLVVGVRSISTTDASLNPDTRFLATIDSTLPFLYLPDAVCDKFVEKFQLKWDNSSQLYTVSDTAHKNNLAKNAAVTFTLTQDPNNGNEITSIELPYAAFDLQTNLPDATSVNYFPIRKSKTGRFVLGRTFLQEAYIIVDYERANFTIAPAVSPDQLPAQQLTLIYGTNDLLPSPTPSGKNGQDNQDGQNNQNGGKGGLAAGPIAGIVVGILLLFLLGLGGFFFWRKRRASKEEHDKVSEIVEIDTQFVPEIKQMGMLELDSSQEAKHPGDYYGDNRDNKGMLPFPPISEMESPPAAPAELYTPPPSSTPAASDSKVSDYFTKPRRRGATRESPGANTPGTPGVAAIHELAGDDGQFQVGGLHFEPVATSPAPSNPSHSRGPSDTKIDQVISEHQSPEATEATESTETTSPTVERRPSHARGASDTTVQSNISQPTPEQMESWALGGKDDPRRPISE